MGCLVHNDNYFSCEWNMYKLSGALWREKSRLTKLFSSKRCAEPLWKGSQTMISDVRSIETTAWSWGRHPLRKSFLWFQGDSCLHILCLGSNRLSKRKALRFQHTVDHHDTLDTHPWEDVHHITWCFVTQYMLVFIDCRLTSLWSSIIGCLSVETDQWPMIIVLNFNPSVILSKY